MGNTGERLLPGTSITYSEANGQAFTQYEELIKAMGGLTLSQLCAVTGLESTTIQNWVKRGWVPPPKSKKYNDAHAARILIINALKDCVKLEQIVQLLEYANVSRDERVKESALFNCLCTSLEMLGRSGNMTHSGLGEILEVATKDFAFARRNPRSRLRKVLEVMILACVCSDVKRRTEAMLDAVIDGENPAGEKEPPSIADIAAELMRQRKRKRSDEPPAKPEPEKPSVPEPRPTVEIRTVQDFRQEPDNQPEQPSSMQTQVPETMSVTESVPEVAAETTPDSGAESAEGMFRIWDINSAENTLTIWDDYGDDLFDIADDSILGAQIEMSKTENQDDSTNSMPEEQSEESKKFQKPWYFGKGRRRK